MLNPSRRRFLAGCAALAAGAGLSAALPYPSRGSGRPPVVLRIEHRVIEVAGKPARVFGLLQANGTQGLAAESGSNFHVQLTNGIDEPALIHWHGLTPPADQDGVPVLSQPPLRAGDAFVYDFPLSRPGTNWMHSHMGLQEQRLMAAPLIVRDPAEAGLDEQEVVVMLHDFTFRDPLDILAELRGGMMAHGEMAHGEMSHGAMSPTTTTDHAAMGHAMMGHATNDGAGGAESAMRAAPGMAMDLNDVAFDAFLANDRTLDDPEIVEVERAGRVRLRIINGAAATNFWLDLGALSGRLVAVDGTAVTPVEGSRFELAIAQRLDIRIDLPRSGGAFPILALREGGGERTGIILATRGAAIRRLAGHATEIAPAVGVDLESRLRAASPLSPRPADRRHMVELTGAMMSYDWGIDGRGYDPGIGLPVGAGERVELVMMNRTGMSHPMHLHGHHFQVAAIGDRPIAGAVRDTVLVPAGGSVTVALDADNPGRWAFHCHNLYHMAAGMMTTLVYRS